MSNNQIKDNNYFADIFKALSNPHRLAIYQRLIRCCQPGTVCATQEIESCCVGDLGAGLDIAPSTVSHHIKELHRTGLIQMRRRGQRVDCWVDPEVVRALNQFFAPN